MNVIVLVRPHSVEELGLIPYFLDEKDPRPAREQFNERYAHGGGWRPQPGYSMNGAILKYPGDPPFEPIAMMTLHDEKILVYEYGVVAIVQRDGSFEVCRMD